jgi:hypothetical protein
MTATILVTAHMGHVLLDAPLFLGPPVAMALALWYSSWKAKRRGDGGGERT